LQQVVVEPEFFWGSGVNHAILGAGGDDVFSAAMPPPKPLARLGGFSLKKKTAK
jgi:hypothetical protein